MRSSPGRPGIGWTRGPAFTFGGHNRLPAAAIDELLAGIGAAVDAAGGGFTMAYQTVVVTASR
jgi:hypothetical protein